MEQQIDNVKKLEQMLKQRDDEIQTKECIIQRVNGELKQTQDKLKEEEMQHSLIWKTVEKGKEDNQKLDEYIEEVEMENRKLNKRVQDLEDKLLLVLKETADKRAGVLVEVRSLYTCTCTCTCTPCMAQNTVSA